VNGEAVDSAKRAEIDHKLTLMGCSPLVQLANGAK